VTSAYLSPGGKVDFDILNFFMRDLYLCLLTHGWTVVGQRTELTCLCLLATGAIISWVDEIRYPGIFKACVLAFLYGPR